MKIFNKIYSLLAIGSILVSCSDFLDTAPKDQLSPATFWKTEADAEAALTACYNDWALSSDIFFSDCMSDIAFSYSGSSNYKYVGNGSTTQSRTVKYYSYTTIRRCNTFLMNAEQPVYSSEEVKKDFIAQARALRAYRYYFMGFWYGGVPLIETLPETAADAQVAKSSEEVIKKFVYDELDAAIPDLRVTPKQRGRISRGAALAMKMRASLYWGDYELALKAAREIQQLGVYELDPDFLNMFSVAGKDSKEIILSMQFVENEYGFGNTVRLYNNEDGGWASMVPTQDLVDMFEMDNGLMPDEEGSNYDATHPFANRDPRLYNTIIYPGQDWVGSNGKQRIVNTLDKEINGKANADYMDAAKNASHTGMIWAKYTTPRAQYESMYDTSLSPILYRYAEVLLTIAEADVELERDLNEALDLIDQLRVRGGQVKVDRSKYTTREQIRELVRRERCIELSGEGMRRADLVRWKDASGKLLAETLLNKTVYRMLGTIDYNEPDPTRRAVLEVPTDANKSKRKLEDRVFYPFQRYLPFPQSELDKNPNLEQNTGYVK